MTARKIVLIALSIILLSNPLTALASICNLPPLVSAFSNGIQNTREEAVRSHEKLMIKAGDLSFQSKLLLYHAKGRIEGEPGHLSFALDMFEVFALLSKEAVGADAQLENEAMAIFHGRKRVEYIPGTFFSKIVGFFEQARNNIEEKAFKVNTPENLRATVGAEVTALTVRLASGENVMLAAHSQGTLWANAVLEQVNLNRPDLMKKVRVAYAGAAASKVWQTPGNSLQNDYVTNENDLVIGALRPLATVFALPNPLPSNAIHPRTFDEPLGHGFEQIYLDDSAPTGIAFLSLFKAGVAQLKREQGYGVIGSMDVLVDVGQAGAAHMEGVNMIINKVYGNTTPTPDTSSGFLSTTESVRTGYSTLKTKATWYCSPNSAQSVGSRLALAVPLPTFYGRPTLISGTVLFEGVSYPISHIGEAVPHPVDFYDWQIGDITYVNTAAGVEPRLTLQ